MRTLHRMSLPAFLASLLVVWTGSFAHGSFPGPQTPVSAEVPVLKAGAGSCSADFVVTDSSGKGVYDAKISVQMQYGFMGLHKLDLTAGTNFDGKARIEGLPEKTKRAADFKISHGNQSKLVPYEPLDSCQAQHQVILGDGPGT
jgi:hypothetical protein